MSKELVFSRRGTLANIIMDNALMIKRSSTHILRNTDQLLGTFFQPIMFYLLFATVFGGAIGQALPDGIDYKSFLMAGIIVQTLAFGSTTTSIAICNDLQKGIIDRFRSLPMNQIAVVNGHVISDLVRNTISTVVMIVTGLVIGFRSSASFLDWLLITAIVLLFTFAFSWLAAIVGIISKSVEGVQWMSFIIVFPLTFASSAFVPTEGMNSVLKAFAVNQPISQIVEAIRALMLGQPVGNHVILSIVWCFIILAVAVPLSIWLFGRRTRQ